MESTDQAYPQEGSGETGSSQEGAGQKASSGYTGTPSPQGPRSGNRRSLVFGGIGVVILLIGVLLFYFVYLGNPSYKVLANVNGEKITLEAYNKELAKMEEPLKSMYREDPEKIVE